MKYAALLLILFAAACGDPGAVTTGAPLLSSHGGGGNCELAMSDADALAAIDALIAEVNALEAAGSLTSGQANALRNHLENARDALLAGRRWPAQAQLKDFRD